MISHSMGRLLFLSTNIRLNKVEVAISYKHTRVLAAIIKEFFSIGHFFFMSLAVKMLPVFPRNVRLRWKSLEVIKYTLFCITV